MKWKRFFTICIFAALITGCNTTKNLNQFPLSESENKMVSKEKCYLCGSKRPDVWDYYEEKGGLVILCLNSWNIGEIPLKNDKDESFEYFTVNEDVNEDDCRWIIRSDPKRHKCYIKIYYSEKSVLDLKVLKSQLCRECYEKVSKAVLESGSGVKQYCSVLMDMNTREIYPVSPGAGFNIKDLDVQIEIFYSIE